MIGRVNKTSPQLYTYSPVLYFNAYFSILAGNGVYCSGFRRHTHSPPMVYIFPAGTIFPENVCTSNAGFVSCNAESVRVIT